MKIQKQNGIPEKGKMLTNEGRIYLFKNMALKNFYDSF